MDTLDIFLLSLPIGLLITWRLLTGSKRQHRDEQRSRDAVKGGSRYARSQNIGRAHSGYEAKRLRICNQPCRAALKLRDHAFRAGEEPDLPLTDCDRAAGCHCEYSLHNDRRGGRDRRYPAEDIVHGEGLAFPDSAVLTDDRREKKSERRKRRAGKRLA